MDMIGQRRRDAAKGGHGNRMNVRRELVVAFCAGAFAPLVSFAQAQGKVWRISFLSQGHLDSSAAGYAYGPFTQDLRELNHVEGRNPTIEWRSAEGKVERLPELAAELVRLKVDVLVPAGTPASFAAQKATTTIPIVMARVGDPVGGGLVKSLARPGGKSTGLSNMANDLGTKRLEMLGAIVPRLERVAVLVNPSNATNPALLKDVQAAAEKAGAKIHSFEAGTPQEIASAFAAMARRGTGALIVLLDRFFQQQKAQIVELAAKHRLPSIGAYGEYAQAGGLMSYGNSLGENYRRAATYVDKIVKGAKPGDLPVEQPTTFELFVNQKTARALGIIVPQTIVIQATRVID